MTKLPTGWAATTLGQLAEYITSGSRDWSKYYAADGALFVRTQDINTNKLAKVENIARVSLPAKVEGKRSLIRQDDLLVTITGANVGRCAHVEGEIPEAYVSQSVALIRLKNRGIAKFLHAQLLAPLATGTKTWLEENSYGIGRPVLSLENIRNVPINLAPFPEQGRIVSTLGIAEAHIRTCRARLARIVPILKDFRRSVLEAATCGRLTADWRELQSQHESGKKIHDLLKTDHEMAGGHSRGNSAAPTEGAHSLRVEDLPESWDITELKDACAVGRPITYGILKPGPELTGGVPYVRVADFPGNKLNIAGLKRTSPEIDEQFKRARLQPNDLLLSIRGSVGRLIKIPNELAGANITQDTARLAISKRLNVDYIYYALLSPGVQTRMQNAMRGVAIRGINIGDVRALQIPLPPLAEQDEIVRKISAFFDIADRLEQRLSTAQAAVDQLFPALLARAFRGELVPQDPNDGPATQLLECTVPCASTTGDRLGRAKRAQRVNEEMLASK